MVSYVDMGIIGECPSIPTQMKEENHFCDL